MDKLDLIKIKNFCSVKDSVKEMKVLITHGKIIFAPTSVVTPFLSFWPLDMSILDDQVVYVTLLLLFSH